MNKTQLLDAISRFASDTRRSPQEVLDDLHEIQEDIEARVEALEADVESENDLDTPLR